MCVARFRSPRHQLIVVAREVLSRVLPPETVGDEWAVVGRPRWEPAGWSTRPGVVQAYLDWAGEESPGPTGPATTYVDNLDGTSERSYRAWPTHIPGWAGITDIPCPRCTGTIRWAEAGRVPGARECDGCGAQYLGVGPALGLGDLLVLTREGDG